MFPTGLYNILINNSKSFPFPFNIGFKFKLMKIPQPSFLFVIRRWIAAGILMFFMINTILPPAYAQEIFLPIPGSMVHLSPAFNAPMLKGIKVYPENPFLFDFILDNGQSKTNGDEKEASKLVKYFLASLTTPENEMWVNLSPYEKDRIVPESFGQTEMGRDLLAQDYMLKQITASLIYPEDELGKKFWERIREEARKKFGTSEIPINMFNKVWIVPNRAQVYENLQTASAYVVESSLKVMLDDDYENMSSLRKQGSILGDDVNMDSTQRVPIGRFRGNDIEKSGNTIGSQIIREIVIPALTKEVNEGKNFAQLRQIYNSLILAAWYKKKIKDSILSQVYVDKNKVAGVNIDDPNEKQIIYERYLEAFKKGTYNYIKEEFDPATQEIIPKKYFSGGFDATTMLISDLTISYNSKDLAASSSLEAGKEIRVRIASVSPENQKRNRAADSSASSAVLSPEQRDQVITFMMKKSQFTENELSQYAAGLNLTLEKFYEVIRELSEQRAFIRPDQRWTSFLETYNEDETPTGMIEEYWKVKEGVAWHKGAELFVISPAGNGKLILQVRNNHKLDISSTGGVEVGMTSNETAKKETKEEIELDLDISEIQPIRPNHDGSSSVKSKYINILHNFFTHRLTEQKEAEWRSRTQDAWMSLEQYKKREWLKLNLNEEVLGLIEVDIGEFMTYYNSLSSEEKETNIAEALRTALDNNIVQTIFGQPDKSSASSSVMAGVVPLAAETLPVVLPEAKMLEIADQAKGNPAQFTQDVLRETREALEQQARSLKRDIKFYLQRHRDSNGYVTSRRERLATIDLAIKNLSELERAHATAGIELQQNDPSASAADAKAPSTHVASSPLDSHSTAASTAIDIPENEKEKINESYRQYLAISRKKLQKIPSVSSFPDAVANFNNRKLRRKFYRFTANDSDVLQQMAAPSLNGLDYEFMLFRLRQTQDWVVIKIKGTNEEFEAPLPPNIVNMIKRLSDISIHNHPGEVSEAIPSTKDLWAFWVGLQESERRDFIRSDIGIVEIDINGGLRSLDTDEWEGKVKSNKAIEDAGILGKLTIDPEIRDKILRILEDDFVTPGYVKMRFSPFAQITSDYWAPAKSSFFDQLSSADEFERGRAIRIINDLKYLVQNQPVQEMIARAVVQDHSEKNQKVFLRGYVKTIALASLPEWQGYISVKQIEQAQRMLDIFQPARSSLIENLRKDLGFETAAPVTAASTAVTQVNLKYPDAVVDPHASPENQSAPVVAVNLDDAVLKFARWEQRSSVPFTAQEKAFFARSEFQSENLKDLQPADIKTVQQTIYDRTSGDIKIELIITDTQDQKHYFRLNGADTNAMRVLKDIMPTMAQLKQPGALLQSSLGNQGDLEGNFTIVSKQGRWEFFGAVDEVLSKKTFRALIQYKNGERKIGFVQAVADATSQIQDVNFIAGLNENAASVKLAADQVEFVFVAYTLGWGSESPEVLLRQNYTKTSDLRHVFRFPSLKNGSVFHGSLASDNVKMNLAFAGQPVEFQMQHQGQAIIRADLEKNLQDKGYRLQESAGAVKQAGDYFIEENNIRIILLPARYPVNTLVVDDQGHMAFVTIQGKSGSQGANYWTVEKWIKEQVQNQFHWEPQAIFALDNGMDPNVKTFVDGKEVSLVAGARDNFNAAFSVVPKEDGAASAAIDTKTKGGIDFNADKLNVETQTRGGEIKFEIDPQQLRELQYVPGFTPVIINIQPMTNVRMFLGLKEKSETPVEISQLH